MDTSKKASIVFLLVAIALVLFCVAYVFSDANRGPVRWAICSALFALCLAIIVAIAFRTDESNVQYEAVWKPSFLHSAPPDPSIVSSGLLRATQCKIVICGLARDCASNLRHIREQIERIGSMFQDYAVLIVENDSKDDTRERLLEWASFDERVTVLGCGKNSPGPCLLKLPPTTYIDSCVTSQPRMRKMVKLRNMYLDEIDENPRYKDYDLVAVWDLDLKGSLYLDGILETLHHMERRPDMDAVCCNSLRPRFSWPFTFYSFHDPYAFKTPRNAEWSKFYNDVYTGLCNSFQGNVFEGEPQPVQSCFGGFTLYRRDRLEGKRYATWEDSHGDWVCEHVGLHRHLKNMHMNPRFVYMVTDNPKPLTG